VKTGTTYICGVLFFGRTPTPALGSRIQTPETPTPTVLLVFYWMVATKNRMMTLAGVSKLWSRRPLTFVAQASTTFTAVSI